MQISNEELKVISEHRSTQRPQQSLMRAAVSIILRDGENGTEFLLMQRAKHDNDPWSGQMSFPGGKIEDADETAKHAAIRETSEEVGLELGEQDYIGRLDDIYGIKVDNQYSVHVACFVFKPAEQISLIANHEVADLVWLPFSYLNDPDNAHKYAHPHDTSVKMPAVMISEHKGQVLWGLSLRMLSNLYELLEWPLSVLSEQENLELQEIEKRNLDSSKINASKLEKIRNRSASGVTH